MNCEKASALFNLCIDNQLDEQSKNQLMNHLNVCPQCKEEYEELLSLVTGLNDIPLCELPIGYHDELMTKLRTDINIIHSAKSKKKLTFFRKYMPIATAAVICLAIGIGIGGGNSMGIGNRLNEASNESAMQSSASMAQPQNSAPKLRSTSQMNSAPSDNLMAAGNNQALIEESGVPHGEIVASPENINGKQAAVAQNNATYERLKIKRSSYTIEVENYDTALNSLVSSCEKNGGYVENSSSYIYFSENDVDFREGNIVLRIPRETYEQTKNSLNDMGKIITSSENVEDVTAQYIDTKSSLDMKKSEMDRLLALVAKTNNIEDIIKIEERLSAVKSEIESLNTMLKNWDKLVDFSTINITVREVKQAKISPIKDDFGTKIKDSFINSANNFIQFCQGLVLVIAENSIFIVCIAAVLVVIAIFVHKVSKKNKD